MIKIKRYGWHPDTPDHRDFKYTPIFDARIIPASIDLTSFMPPIYDQLELGSCTAQAIAADLQYLDINDNSTSIMPSRLFIYYCERVLEDTVSIDSGATIRDGMKAINRWGYPAEELWPYNISKFARKPPARVYSAAGKRRVLNYSRVPQTVEHLRSCLAEKLPVVFGFSVYESFESEHVRKTGMVPMPLHSEALIGGHAVLLTGYDHDRKLWLVRNSWGESWGRNGNCWFPYNYLLDSDMASDFWAVRSVPV